MVSNNMAAEMGGPLPPGDEHVRARDVNVYSISLTLFNLGR